jgi:hypothetical protein
LAEDTTLEEIRSDSTISDEERRYISAAYHETGHAVVGHLLGYDIPKIDISTTGSVYGYTVQRRQQPVAGIVNWDIGNGGTDDSPLADQLTYLYGGVVADRRLYLERGISSNLPEEDQDDIHRARGSVRDLPEGERFELLTSAEKRATELLSDPQNWQILERIAAIVLKNKVLSDKSLHEQLEMLSAC